MNRVRREKIKSRQLPINLLRKAQREQRVNNNIVVKKRKRKTSNKLKSKEEYEHEALVQKTKTVLRQILQNDDVLSDIPYNATPEELLGEIAFANGEATTVYVQRDGLSTLTIVLPQTEPTIANLKRAIESVSSAQLQRELEERYEDRLRRRVAAVESSKVNIGVGVSALERDEQEKFKALESLKPCKSTGELVCSAIHNQNGHPHRSNVSWRFLWRAYALFRLDTHTPINDENGRQLLSELGIENGATLKFCKREKYFGRKRQ